MDYRATITIDYTGQNQNDYQKLVSALIEIGWKRQETSALTVECDSLAPIWGAFDLIARQSANAGTLSALAIQVQGSPNGFAGTTYAATKNHPTARADIQGRPYPKY